MSVPEATGQAEPGTSTIARLLASDMREELLAVLREILTPSAGAGRLAYSPDEVAEGLASAASLSTTCCVPASLAR